MSQRPAYSREDSQSGIVVDPLGLGSPDLAFLDDKKNLSEKEAINVVEDVSDGEEIILASNRLANGKERPIETAGSCFYLRSQIFETETHLLFFADDIATRFALPRGD